MGKLTSSLEGGSGDEEVGASLVPLDLPEGGLSWSGSSLFDVFLDAGGHWSRLPGDLLRGEVFFGRLELLVGSGLGLGFGSGHDAILIKILL